MEARAVIPNAPKALRFTDRYVVPDGAVGAMETLEFGRSVNPISTRGADYAHHVKHKHPRLSDLPMALIEHATKSL